MTHELQTDILIVGGGMGGCAAAMAATSLGCRVILTEPTDWLGGQLTSQAVPPDENPWIEEFGCTARYRRFREGVRDYYRQAYPLRTESAQDPRLNPGKGNVSRLCHEPRVALAVIEQMLAFERASSKLRVLLRHEPIGADAEGDRVRSVTLLDRNTGDQVRISAPYILDATELGDLLPLAGVEYVSGAESRADTGEPHATDGPADPENVQAITWCFPMAFDPTPGADHVIDKPRDYERWRDYVPQMTPPWTGRLISWKRSHPHNCQLDVCDLFGETNKPEVRSLWFYRRIVTAEHFESEHAPHEITMVNWPQNDYIEGNLIDKPADEVARYRDEAKQLSLSLFYWMQTEADRPDGGCGYPGLYLCPDQTGTADGLAMEPYIRESRRIKAAFTVTENHVGFEALGGKPAATFNDSVGIGYYRIDLHPSTGGDNYIDVASMPFQIPLGSLLPVRESNLIAACKNLGVTHIANGCYRLHPVEWNIGEAAGLLAATCVMQKTEPRQIYENAERLSDFQSLLTKQGFELEWPSQAIEDALKFA